MKKIHRISQEMKEFAGTHRRKRRWLTVVTCLAAVVVFSTTYALILPAITLEKEQTLACSYEVHQHDESCFDKGENVICGYADYVVHIHDSNNCYDADGNLVCELAELEAHEHDASCYEDGTVLTCEKQEVILHTHTEECYAGDGSLTCGLLQVEEHQHDSSCLVNPDAGITAALEDDDVETTAKYTPVKDGFFLWLKLFDEDGNTRDIYSNPVWANGAFQSSGIEDALTYTDESETWYLIPVSYFTNYYGEYGYKFDPKAVCPFKYAPDAQDNAANLTAASYVQVAPGEIANETTDGNEAAGDNKTTDGNENTGGNETAGGNEATGGDEASGWYVRVQDKGSYGNPNNPRSNIYYTVPAQVVTDTVSPSGTVINLFDYWTTEKSEKDVTVNNYDSGINENHALKFKATGLSGANVWTETADVYQNIVANTLGTDGYPKLSGQEIFGDSSEHLVSSDESLAYLFDPTYTGSSSNYRDAYRNVTGLLQVDEDGYYYYDSTKNYAEFDSTQNGFTIYDQWSLTYTSNNLNTINGQFFPFDPYSTVSKTITAGSDSLNHFFGMTLTTRFVQQYDGHTNSARNKETTFEFSGDDDVWIFIDGVLVADLGGIHDPASVTINFATGDVVVNEEKDYKKKTTLYEAFQKAGKEDTVEWSTDEDENGHSDTFANNTYHTLRFYYLERGSFASNLSLRYNLSSYPPTGINKVNQYGDAVAGAEFSVYPATVDANGIWTYNENSNPVYTGVTDADGQMVFVDEDNMPYTLTELKNMFGEYFVLKETRVPAGYRLVNEEIRLHITNGVIMCENTYESGVWADAELQVTAPNKVKLVDETIREVVDENLVEKGKIFAVVLKYTGDSLNSSDDIGALSKQDNWAPVYGTSETGFTIVDVAEKFNGNFTSAVIDTAKQYEESDNIFSMSAGSGALMGGLSGMPGDLTTYYYMLPADEKYKTQYTVAYYWTEADTLDNATADNTFRINADAAGGYSFDRIFGSTINVPNLLNRLLVQKLDEDGNLVKGAKFAMYGVKEIKDSSENGSTIYYCANDNAETLIYLSPDTNGDNEGEATVKDSNVTGTYKVNSATGVITVTVGDNTYEIVPEPYAIEGGSIASTVTANDDNNPTDEDGTAAFTNMSTGTYYVREIEAPSGYQINSTEVMALVDESAVYANAGTANDGVTVARGTGYLVSSVDQFASQGDIDNTLTWIFEMMRVSPVSTSFADSDFVHSEAYKSWGYLKENYDGENLTEKTTQHEANDALRTYLTYSPDANNQLFNYVVNTERVNNGDTRRLYTNVGWSYYELYQDWHWALGVDGNILSHKNESAAYTLLTDNGERTGNLVEIANLFSRATYIQVTDAKVTGDLEIRKTVVNAGNAPKNDSGEFEFTVTLKNAKGTALTGSYHYTVYDVDENGNRTPATNEDGSSVTGYIETNPAEDDAGNSSAVGSYTITLTDHQVAVIENLPAGTRYVITESGSNEFVTTAEKKVLKEPTDPDDGESGDSSDEENGLPYSWKTYSFGMDESERTVEGTLYWYVDEEDNADTTSVVHYTNTYLPDLTLLKVDAGNQDTKLEGAEFVFYKTVTLEAEDGKEASTETRYYCNGNWVKLSEANAGETGITLESVTQTTGKEGKITFLNIPGGTYYLEEVKAPNGYNLLADKITVTVSDGVIKAAFMNTTMYSPDNTDEIWLTLTVTNSSGYELPKTGGAGTNLFTIGGLLFMAVAVGCGYGLRCRRERRAK